MDARQRVKLSLTNRSIGLISSPCSARSGKAAPVAIPRNDTHPTSVFGHLTQSSTAASRFRAAGRPGGHSEGPAPDPIPNSAVKTLRANGTAS